LQHFFLHSLYSVGNGVKRKYLSRSRLWDILILKGNLSLLNHSNIRCDGEEESGSEERSRLLNEINPTTLPVFSPIHSDIFFIHAQTLMLPHKNDVLIELM
jgi:hypothetical protein